MSATEADWGPLLDMLGERGVGDFMFMGSPWARVRSFKHIDSRRYLHLDERGEAWRYDSATRLMRPCSRADAVRYALSEIDDPPGFTDR